MVLMIVLIVVAIVVEAAVVVVDGSLCAHFTTGQQAPGSRTVGQFCSFGWNIIVGQTFKKQERTPLLQVQFKHGSDVTT